MDTACCSLYSFWNLVQEEKVGFDSELANSDFSVTFKAFLGGEMPKCNHAENAKLRSSYRLFYSVVTWEQRA